MGRARVVLHRGRWTLVALTVLGAPTGCTTELVMARVHSSSEPSTRTVGPETTIRYTAVRAETRDYPDYGNIDRSILAGGPADQGEDEGQSTP